MMAKVPGSLNTGFWRTGFNSPTRDGVTAAAPRNVTARRATKKKRSIFGGPPSTSSGPDTDLSSGLISSSILLAISVVVSRLYPGGGMTMPNIKFLLPSGRYSSLGRKTQAPAAHTNDVAATTAIAAILLRVTRLVKPTTALTNARAR